MNPRQIVLRQMKSDQVTWRIEPSPVGMWMTDISTLIEGRTRYARTIPDNRLARMTDLELNDMMIEMYLLAIGLTLTEIDELLYPPIFPQLERQVLPMVAATPEGGAR